MIASGMPCFPCCKVPYPNKCVNARRYQYCTLKIWLWIVIGKQERLRYVNNVINELSFDTFWGLATFGGGGVASFETY